jgi:hypothetical protein
MHPIRAVAFSAAALLAPGIAAIAALISRLSVSSNSS